MTFERVKPWLIGLAIAIVFAIAVLLAWATVNMLSGLHDVGQAAGHGGMD